MLFIFFFFKQKTAYEMLRSLVGSEMCIRDRYQRRVRGSSEASAMATDLHDDAKALTEALGEQIRTMILQRAHEIRAGCLRVDPAQEGIISIADFRKVLYFEGGLPYSAVSAVLANAAPPGPGQHHGFVHYDIWIHSFCDIVQTNAAVAAPKPPELKGGFAPLAPENIAAVLGDIRHVVSGNFDKIMRVFVLHDLNGTGLIPTPEFKRVLHMEVGIPVAHLEAVFSAARIESNHGFMDYGEWLRFVSSSSVPSATDLGRFHRPAHHHGPPPPGPYDPAAAQLDAHRRAFHAHQSGEALLDEELAAMHGTHLGKAEQAAEADAAAHRAMAVREAHVAEEQRVGELRSRLHTMDAHVRDVAFEQHILETQIAEENRLLRVSAEKQDEHTLLRNALREPPAAARFTKELLAEKRARELTPAQSARLVDELLEIHVTSPTRAMGFVQRLPLDPRSKLDLFNQIRTAVNTKEDRFVRDLRVLEYLNTANPEGTLGPKQEAELLDKIRRTTASAAKKVEVLKEMPIDAAKKLELLHELRLYNVIEQGNTSRTIGNPLA
eukprot:TRINITY_DN19160_c0_g1_i5.p1 TRINITY_DN19160_c0_g1~~TRINITY_DN19160_c0_g1_i5.p1  ORF type:complete len:552 (+),score=172.95 TRINITY_DN19160_c0_g1_i5:97-1752(+)